jgi:hypothetical protein
MTRSKRSQAAHDKKVREEANKLKSQGFAVDADIEGFPKPKTLGGYRPDVIATKGKQRKIIEIETEESKDSARDKSQQQAFRRAADRSKNTTFRRKIANK